METVLLRSNSSGLKGTYKNIDHHAKKARPVVEILVKQFELMQLYIKKWKQGHNVHVIESLDGRSLVFTPYANESETIGVQVSIYVSRFNRIKLFHLTNRGEALTFINFLHSFLVSEENHYGKREE